MKYLLIFIFLTFFYLTKAGNEYHKFSQVKIYANNVSPFDNPTETYR